MRSKFVEITKMGPSSQTGDMLKLEGVACFAAQEGVHPIHHRFMS